MKSHYLFFLVGLLLCSCNKRDKQISAHHIKPYLKDSLSTYYLNLNEDSCKLSFDTLDRNLNLTFDEAILALQKHYEEVDIQVKDDDARKYTKALITADFTYAALSYLLNLDSGKTQYENIHRDLQQYSLREIYSLGNSNSFSFYCGQRAYFYSLLVDTLLGLKTITKSIDETHTFPLTQINGKYYLIDPYDPFVVIDEHGKIPDWEVLLKKTDITMLPSGKVFGNSRMLLRRELIDNLVSKNCSKDYCGVFCLFKQRATGATFYGGVDFHHPKIIKNNPNYEYAVNMIGRPEADFAINKKILETHYLNAD